MSDMARPESPPDPSPGSGAHSRSHRPAWHWVLAVLLVLLVLTIAAGAAVRLQHGSGRSAVPAAVSTRPVVATSGPAPAPCPGAALHVVAAPEIAAVIRQAARTLAPAGADCGPVEVTAEEPAATVAAARRPEVWIPSSSAWLQMAAGSGAAYVAKADPLAHSPLVLAAPSAITGLYTQDGRTSWAALVDGAARRKIPAVTMPDPLTSTVGLLSVYAVHQAMTRTTPDAGIAQLRALTLRSRLQDAAANPAETVAKLAAETDASSAVYDVGVFPTTEQQLAAYQRGGQPVTLAGAVPVDGPVEADYPYAIAANAPHADLAARLRSAITADALTRAGFRISATAGVLGLPAKADPLLGAAQQWSRYRSLRFQVLVLVDASGSMNQQVKDRAGQTTTKAALLRESGVAAAQLFGDDTSIGLWLFGTPASSSPAHAEVVPMGPITAPVGGKPRRAVLAAGMASYRAADGSGTPLYQAVLDGQAAMRAEVRPGTVTLVVVLTDGRDGGSRFAMSLPAFLGKLQAQRDPSRPVPIIGVGYGADADMTALSAMARATGGSVIPARNPADLASAMARAFLAAHESS